VTLLQVNSLTTGHNGVAVVHDVNLMVESGEVVALLGANGARWSVANNQWDGVLQ
jgi:branched-chain amino acid transport system ATP-binding protein